ncbi:MAG: phosphatase domain-containing protein [Pseudomonadota bacterium]
MVGSASRTARRGKIVVKTYRGYGSAEHLFLIGRVLREASPELPAGDGLWHNLKTIWRLMRAWGIADAELTGQFGELETTIKTDRDGYFRLTLDLPKPPPTDRHWHEVAIRLETPMIIETVGDVFVPGPDCSFVVISDIDDTVMHTGVANKLLMMWRLFIQGAESRTAIPGMASFLRALYRGPSGDGAHPMLYVSRAPWAIYGVLERFFKLHNIPVGPILFLREWGLTLQHPIPRRGKGHKRDLICQMVEHYETLPFILIGDSGQRDPEVYADIVKTFPKRVLAVYIRNVGGDPRRDQAIADLAAKLESLGSPLVLASDIRDMAAHAVQQGWITGEGQAAIERDLGAQHQLH